MQAQHVSIILGQRSSNGQNYAIVVQLWPIYDVIYKRRYNIRALKPRRWRRLRRSMLLILQMQSIHWGHTHSSVCVSVCNTGNSSPDR